MKNVEDFANELSSPTGKVFQTKEELDAWLKSLGEALDEETT